ncbi:GMC oxidoreductase [Pseudoduganella flava]|uniref:GMC family oxidoreductase n=1 Tax=Pseudoduganella flava TaxID=871742 RepID=A0A562PHR6_9BURK|nr:GMC family oxidoreductase N-terminal domain-containing protein [Pseudoduganella flava]QGZ37632.1 GMC family oxidoreductase [Pseudoduganella flava]TWI44005.1 GMC oxidoreductase [Pseudoduganella flava]
MKDHPEYDAIVVGSGTAGAMLAREWSRQNKRVLLLERGGDAPLRESVTGFASVIDQVKVGRKLATVRALTKGGSTGLYFGVVNAPPLDVFNALGIDLASDVDALRRELPIAPLPDALLGEQALRLRDGAVALGHAWHKHDMLVDQSRCDGGYSHGALWRARSYVDDAVAQGTRLVTRATVQRVLIENGAAIGVEYRERRHMFSNVVHRAYAGKVVLAAGELATPALLRACGVDGVGRHGFYVNPGYAIYGLVPGMQGRDNFVGSMGCQLDDGIELGDANICRFLYKMMMPAKLKFRHAVAYPQAIAIGVKVKDGLGGELRADGGLHKELSEADFAKLKKGEEEALRILRQAGAQHIFNFGLSCAGRVGGLLRIGEHVDARMESPVRNLHVCDGSIIPDEMRGTPTLTVLAMARYLARQLAPAL